jgi:hypothetical protein
MEILPPVLQFPVRPPIRPKIALQGASRLRQRILLILTLVLCPIAATAASIDVTREGELITVRRVTRGASVLVVTFVNEPNSYRVKQSASVTTLSDTDNDGAVAMTLAVTGQSLTVAVDLATGDVGTLTPGGRPINLSAKHFTSLARTLRHDADHIDAAGDQLDFLVVRPGVGAWIAETGDDTDADDDPSPDAIRIAVSDLRALSANSPSLSTLTHGDVVIAVQPDTLDAGIARVGGAQ